MFRGSLPTKLPHASAAWQFQYNSRTQVRAWEMTRPQRRSISILETQRAGGIHRFTLHRPLSGGFSTWLRCGAFNLPRRTYSSCHTDAPPWRSAASIEVVGTAPDLATQTFPSPNNTFPRAANPDHMSNTKSKSTIPTSRTTHRRHPRSAPKDDEEVGHRITKEKVELFHHTDVRGFDEAFLEQFSSCKKAMQGVHVSAGNRRRFNRGMQHEMNTFCEEVGLATIPSRRRSRDKRRPDSVLVRNTRLGDPQRVAQSTPSTPPDVNTRDHKIVVATRCGEDLFHLEEHEEEKFMPNVWFTRDEIRTYGFRLRRGTTPLTLWIAKKAKI